MFRRRDEKRAPVVPSPACSRFPTCPIRHHSHYSDAEGNSVRNEVQLITYPDRLAGDLPGLHQLLTEQLPGVFSGVHVLPFCYPIDGADAGFDPIDQRDVDERIGTW